MPFLCIIVIINSYKIDTERITLRAIGAVGVCTSAAAPRNATMPSKAVVPLKCAVLGPDSLQSNTFPTENS